MHINSKIKITFYSIFYLLTPIAATFAAPFISPSKISQTKTFDTLIESADHALSNDINQFDWFSIIESLKTLKLYLAVRVHVSSYWFVDDQKL